MTTEEVQKLQIGQTIYFIDRGDMREMTVYRVTPHTIKCKSSWEGDHYHPTIDEYNFKMVSDTKLKALEMLRGLQVEKIKWAEEKVVIENKILNKLDVQIREEGGTPCAPSV